VTPTERAALYLVSAPFASRICGKCKFRSLLRGDDADHEGIRAL
jgi:hypothetical protein